jgi:MtN3 and saliva related transmembrane protein
MITLLGIASGCMTTLCWLPQLIHTWRTRQSEAISALWLLTLGTGVAGWVAYGVLKSDVAVIFANALTLLLLCGLVAMKYLRAGVPPEPAASGPQPR